MNRRLLAAPVLPALVVTVLVVTVLVLTVLGLPQTGFAAEGDETVQSAIETLEEVMSSPGKSIPASLLRDAQGVAIIPGVIRVGVIAGVRRGKGVVVVRETDGSWALPQFVTLTGGNLGFQIGAESADVVLVFKTKRSVANLMEGKFTIGTDAGAAAGPVGRRVEAATDVQLKAEIYSYSRSRGLFAGVSLDGSKISLDPAAYKAYYGASGEAPPRAALQLVESLATLAERKDEQPASQETIPGEVEILPRPDAGAETAELRRRLGESSMKLQPKLDATWSRFLALPREVYDGRDPKPESLSAALRNYTAVTRDGRYRALAELPEFQRTYELLSRYAAALTPPPNTLDLPPPPTP